MCKKIILGIDPGLLKTGWAIIGCDNLKLYFIAGDVIQTNSKASMSERLFVIYSGLANIIDKYSPYYASVEITFVNKNPMSSLKLESARGAILLTLSLFNLNISEYGANAVKKYISGYGHASKAQMKFMVKHLCLNVGEKIKDDISDAIALALCCAYSNNLC